MFDFLSFFKCTVMCFCEFSLFKEVKLLFYLSWELGAKIKQAPLYQYRVRCQVKILPWGYMGTFLSIDGVQLTAGEFPTNSGIFAIYLQIKGRFLKINLQKKIKKQGLKIIKIQR